MTGEASTQSSVTRIKDRLLSRFDPLEVPGHIQQRASRIEQLVTTMHEADLLSDYDRLQRDHREGMEPTTKQRFEDRAIAYLVCQLGSPQRAEHIRMQARTEQIQAIVALVEKDHIQAPTGSGKSSLVLPIASLVSALSHQEATAVATVSPELREQLEQRIQELSIYLPLQMRPDIFVLERTKQPKNDDEPTPTETFAALAQQIVAPTPDTEDPFASVDQTQRRGYFHNRVYPQAQYLREINQNIITQEPEKGGPSLTILVENDCVFYTMGHKRGFDQVIFDEVHVPKARGKDYYQTPPSEFITPEMAEEFLFRRMLSGVMHEVIEKNDLFEQREGLFWFKDDDAEAMFYRNLHGGSGRPQMQKAIEKAAAVIAPHLGIADPDQLATWFGDSLTSSQTNSDSLHSFDDLSSELLLNLSKARLLREGVHYLQKDQQVVRDYFMGLSLPSHHHTAEMVLALQTLQGTVEFESYYQSAGTTTSFEGWVINYLHGNLTGLSGTMFVPSLTDPSHIDKTPLTRFLEGATGHAPVFFEAKSAPHVLHPKIIEPGTVADISSDRRQTLLFCFDENKATELAQRLRAENPGREVWIADSSMDEKEAHQLYEQFANSSDVILISTGRVGAGVDIKSTTTNQHPDLKIVIYGMPFSKDQVFQAMGRRRLAGTPDDYLWLLSTDDITSYPAFEGLDEDRQEKIRALFAKNPLAAAEELIVHSESIQEKNVRIEVENDTIFRSTLGSFSERLHGLMPAYFTDVLEFIDITDVERRVLERFVSDLGGGRELGNLIEEFVGTPGNMYWILEKMRGQLSPGTVGDYKRALDVYLTDEDEENYTEWLEASKPLVTYFLENVLLEQLRSVGNIQIEEDGQIRPATLEDLDASQDLRFTIIEFQPIDIPKPPPSLGETIWNDSKNAEMFHYGVTVADSSGRHLLLEAREQNLGEFVPLTLRPGQRPLSVFDDGLRRIVAIF